MMSSKFNELISNWITYLWLTLIRPCIKGFLRRTTGLCELQRICYATRGSSSERSLQIEQSLSLSRSIVIQRVKNRFIFDANSAKNAKGNKVLDECDVDDELQLVNFAVEAICLEKSINRKIHQEFVTGLRNTLIQLHQFTLVTNESLQLSYTPYDKNNADHVALLLRLWNALKNESYKNISDCKWTSIGFQGNDPSTDFRGMGIFSLMQLVFFAEEFPETVSSVLNLSSHPTKGYPFAVTGINLTHLTITLMTQGILKVHFYNLNSSPYISMNDVHTLYCHIFTAFNSFWLKENPVDIMEFRLIREKFTQHIISYLTNNPDSTLINWKCPVVECI